MCLLYLKQTKLFNWCLPHIWRWMLGWESAKLLTPPSRNAIFSGKDAPHNIVFRPVMKDFVSLNLKSIYMFRRWSFWCQRDITVHVMAKHCSVKCIHVSVVYDIFLIINIKWKQLPNLPPRIDHRHYTIISDVHLWNKNSGTQVKTQSCQISHKSTKGSNRIVQYF